MRGTWEWFSLGLQAVAIAGCELAKAFSELRQTGIEKEMDLGPMLPGDQFGCIIRLLSYDRSKVDCPEQHREKKLTNI